jgi:hypothetical protein
MMRYVLPILVNNRADCDIDILGKAESKLIRYYCSPLDLSYTIVSGELSALVAIMSL